MASWDSKKVADATTELGKRIAEALHSWAQEVGAGDIASDVMDRVHEGFDVVLDRATRAAGKARTKAKSTARKATKKASKKVRTVAKKKTTRKTPTTKKTVRKKT
jgi:hypothetical protein